MFEERRHAREKEKEQEDREEDEEENTGDDEEHQGEEEQEDEEEEEVEERELTWEEKNEERAAALDANPPGIHELIAPSEYTVTKKNKDGEDEVVMEENEEGNMVPKRGHRLEVFERDNWLQLFWFIFHYVSLTTSEAVFVHSVTKGNQRQKFRDVITISDLIFCLNSWDNNELVWLELAPYGGKVKNMLGVKQVHKAKYTKGENKSNELKKKYLALQKKVTASVKRIDHCPVLTKDFNKLFFWYMERSIAIRELKRGKKTNGGKKRKRDEKPEVQDLDDHEMMDHLFGLIEQATPPTTVELQVAV